MDDSGGKLNRRTFLYGAGGLTVASVLAGCSGGSSGDNGTEGGTGGTKTESGAAAETATDTEAKTGAGTSTETETNSGTELTETRSETNTETNTETETNTTTETGNDTQTESTDSTTEDENDEDYEGRESHRLTFGEIREQPPSTLDDLNQEYVELINTTGSTIDLSGYTITYGDGAKYTFDDGFKLPVDQPVTVHTGSGNDSDTDVYVGRDEVALNYKGPDTVTVKNENGTVVLKATV